MNGSMKAFIHQSIQRVSQAMFCLGLLGLLAFTAAAQPGPATVGFDLSGKAVHPFFEQEAHAIVLVFLRTDCPISNRYAPELLRLRKQFKPSEVRWWFIYPNDDIATIQKHIKEYGFASSGVLRDPQHLLIKQFGITVTPEVTVFMHEQKDSIQIYRGRIDDGVVAFGKQRPAATKHDLREVINAVLSKKPMRLTSQPAIGCYISANQ